MRIAYLDDEPLGSNDPIYDLRYFRCWFFVAFIDECPRPFMDTYDRDIIFRCMIFVHLGITNNKPLIW